MRSLLVAPWVCTAVLITSCGGDAGPGDATGGGGSAPCAQGAWDHDGDSSTACLAWTECVAGEHVAAEGTPTTDRVCAPSGWLVQFGAGDDTEPTGLALDPSGNVLVVGHTNGSLLAKTSGAGARHAFVRKYTVDGDEVWTREFGSTRRDDGTRFARALAVAVDQDGSVLVAGDVLGALARTSRSGRVDAFVRKYASDGSELWTEQFGGTDASAARAVAVDGSGNVFVGGGTDGVGLFVRKYTSDGAPLWTYEPGPSWGSDWDSAGALAAGANGDIVEVHHEGPGGCCGSGSVTFTGTLFARKISADADEVWAEEFGGYYVRSVGGVALDALGQAFTVGTASGEGTAYTDRSQDEALVVARRPNGDVLWSKQFGSPAEDAGTSVGVDGTGNVVVAGSTAGALPGETSFGGTDAFFRIYSPGPAEGWTAQLGTPGDDGAIGVALDGAGAVILAGRTEGAFPGYENEQANVQTFVTRIAP